MHLPAGAVGGAGTAAETDRLSAKPGAGAVPKHYQHEVPRALFCMLVLPLFYFCLNIVHTLLVVLFKWLIIGAYKSVDQAFYTLYHIKWMGMILLNGSMEHMSLLLGCSVFNNIFYRLLGASVGKNAYIEGGALEYDLLSVGEGATVGRETYPQCHTVERLVICNAPITLESSATMRSGSVIMPGATLMSAQGFVPARVLPPTQGGGDGYKRGLVGQPGEPPPARRLFFV